jgi:hypothetical protein
VDGRPELLDEVRTSPADLRDYLASEFRDLIDTSAFLDALAGHLPADAASQSRLPELLRRVRSLAVK